MQRDRSDIESSLQKKGFQYVSGKGRAKDHRYYRYFWNGRLISGVETRVSLGTSYKSIGEPLLGQMAKQCKLSHVEFIQLVDCPLSKEQYEAILRHHGLLDEEAAEI